jgi:hypothetical protein
MKTFSSLALLAVGAVAQVIESQSFGYGERYATSTVACPLSRAGSDQHLSPGYRRPTAIFPDGTLEERAMNLLL